MAQGKRIDMTGAVYGLLTVLAYHDTAKGVARWRVRCQCGSEVIARGPNMRSGRTRSCGCVNRKKASDRMTAKNLRHGATGSPEWSVWSGMRHRCSSSHPEYGGRGIRVCERWESFENFLADMGPRPTRSYSIDRIDVNGNYEPGNCRWATVEQQNRNKRDTVNLEFGGRTQCLAEWARERGMETGTLWRRIKQGWSIEAALTTPVNLNLSRKNRINELEAR